MNPVGLIIFCRKWPSSLATALDRHSSIRCCYCLLRIVSIHISLVHYVLWTNPACACLVRKASRKLGGASQAENAPNCRLAFRTRQLLFLNRTNSKVVQKCMIYSFISTSDYWFCIFRHPGHAILAGGFSSILPKVRPFPHPKHPSQPIRHLIPTLGFRAA
jgi:hypothetical protein